MVLMTPAIGSGEGTTRTLECQQDGTASWSNLDFTAVFVTSVAEAPGFVVVMLLSDRIGRRWCGGRGRRGRPSLPQGAVPLPPTALRPALASV